MQPQSTFLTIQQSRTDGGYTTKRSKQSRATSLPRNSLVGSVSLGCAACQAIILSLTVVFPVLSSANPYLSKRKDATKEKQWHLSVDSLIHQVEHELPLPAPAPVTQQTQPQTAEAPKQ